MKDLTEIHAMVLEKMETLRYEMNTLREQIQDSKQNLIAAEAQFTHCKNHLQHIAIILNFGKGEMK